MRIEEIKPEEQTSRMILGDYRALLIRFDNCLAEEIGNRRSKTRHAHPWLGLLTAHQWLFLSAVHQRQHRMEIKSILKYRAVTG